MPELPEVEAARRAIETHCLGKKIRRSIVADDPKVIDGVSPSDFQASLLGKTIIAAHRKGKNMWLELDSPPFPSFQFGMAGAIYIKGVAVTKYKRSAVNDTDEWPSKYSKLFMELEDGLELSFTDKRRFAKVRLLKNPKSVPPISELGPDALYELMPVDEFVESLSKKKIAIKALLLDQSYISGIGNWIADEVLYQSRIHPLQHAFSLSKESCEALHKCIKDVVQYAVEVDADCSCFPIEWLFHFRWGKRSGKVDGKKIDFITAGGRTTAYVPELQKLTGKQMGKAPIRSTKQSTDKDENGDGDGEGEDELGSEKEITEKANSKKGQKTSKGRAMKPPVKRKSKESGSNDDHGDDGEEKKTTKMSKTLTAKVETSKKTLKNSKTSTQIKKKAKK
ncbi:formamidopyrimidine-DNA glycosylase isoform X3 [Macadamia integrifolia]|uniref:formamidopyrimidine-DNA glycosylase isoform X3 n=1 Tax=Macadamia integrifolia TaxID=60698 RepID=UPI001C4FB581|nr:formamidopyrimidine-DNA glycosylase isoform X3 [Macadamia integrifolia]